MRHGVLPGRAQAAGGHPAGAGSRGSRRRHVSAAADLPPAWSTGLASCCHITYIHTCIYIHMHTYIHTHTHMYADMLPVGTRLGAWQRKCGKGHAACAVSRVASSMCCVRGKAIGGKAGSAGSWPSHAIRPGKMALHIQSLPQIQSLPCHPGTQRELLEVVRALASKTYAL